MSLRRLRIIEQGRSKPTAHEKAALIETLAKFSEHRELREISETEVQGIGEITE